MRKRDRETFYASDPPRPAVRRSRRKPTPPRPPPPSAAAVGDLVDAETVGEVVIEAAESIDEAIQRSIDSTMPHEPPAPVTDIAGGGQLEDGTPVTIITSAPKRKRRKKR